MTEKPPVWKGNILYVWSEHNNSYVANYSIPIHQLLYFGKSVEEWKKMFGLDKYKVIE